MINPSDLYAIDCGSEDAALAGAIRDFQTAHPELVPGTISSTYGLAAYLRARGYVKEFRFADPERLASVWNRADREEVVCFFVNDDGTIEEGKISAADRRIGILRDRRRQRAQSALAVLGVAAGMGGSAFNYESMRLGGPGSRILPLMSGTGVAFGRRS